MTTFTSFVDGFPFAQKVTKTWSASRHAIAGVVVGLDVLVILAAMVMAPQLRNAFPELGTYVAEPEWTVPAIAIAWLLALRQLGSYSPRHLRAGVTEYKRVIGASLGTAGAVGIICYLGSFNLSRLVFIGMFALGTAGLVLARFARRKFMHALHREGYLRTPVIVAGATGHVDSVAKVLSREKWLGYQVLGALTSDPAVHTPSGLPVFGRLSEIASIVREREVASVIFAEGSFSSPADFRRMAWELEQLDVQMVVVPNLADISAQRLDVRPVAGLPLVDVERPQAIAATRWIKRTWDIVGSLVLLVIAAPIMAGVALAIWLEDRGPVIFRQVRVGRSGQEFHCLKFRSMGIDAEARLAELVASNEAAGPLFKMARDPRVTRVGRFIRRFSLDELPQLWNALRGDMSLVGPRPALPKEVAQYDPDTRRRLDVRPGLTGLWQVSGRSKLSWEDTVRLDLYYVDNWSIVQDLMILARTARAVVGSAGAY